MLPFYRNMLIFWGQRPLSFGTGVASFFVSPGWHLHATPPPLHQSRWGFSLGGFHGIIQDFVVEKKPMSFWDLDLLQLPFLFCKVFPWSHLLKFFPPMHLIFAAKWNSTGVTSAHTSVRGSQRLTSRSHKISWYLIYWSLILGNHQDREGGCSELQPFTAEVIGESFHRTQALERWWKMLKFESCWNIRISHVNIVILQRSFVFFNHLFLEGKLQESKITGWKMDPLKMSIGTYDW